MRRLNSHRRSAEAILGGTVGAALADGHFVRRAQISLELCELAAVHPLLVRLGCGEQLTHAGQFEIVRRG